MSRAAPALALAFVVATAAATGACKKGESEGPRQGLATSDSWCPDGFELGAADTCIAVPEPRPKDAPVLIYLHGMYEGHGSADEWSTVLGAAKRGFAVVMPRGRRGLCAWKAELKDHFCWPQEVDDPQQFKSVVASWDAILWQVDAILGPGTHKRYVLGFSNGGFFAAHLAENGYFGAAAYAVVGGGQLAPRTKGKPVPILLLAAEGDSFQGPTTKTMHETLAKASWPHAYCTRPGPHGLTGVDVDVALRFFQREGEGRLKAEGGLFPCEGAHAGEGGK